MNDSINKPRLLSRDREEKLALAARYAALLAVSLVFVVPFLWMVSVSFRGDESIYALRLIPEKPTAANYSEVWNDYGIKVAFLNSALVAAAVVVLNVLFCSLAAYPLARLSFPGSRLIFLLILGTLMIPFQLYMVPLFLLARKMGLHDSLIGVVLPTAAGAMGIYLLKQYYETIPRELDEAARIDGATEFGLWWRIMMPLTKPAVAAVAIFVFVQNWSSFLWPLLILDSKEKYTLPVAVARLSGTFVDRTPLLIAGSVIAILPVIVLFFALQRFFIGGLTLGSVKG